MPARPPNRATGDASTAPPESHSWNIGLWGLLIPLIAVAVYLPTVRYGWVGWDDEAYVTANPLMTEPGGLARIWSSGEPDQYYPLTFTTFWLEYRLWQRSPAGYHLTNVLIHAANTLLLLLLLRSFGVARWTSCVVCFLFAVHPLQTMSVAWIAQRKNLLSGAFCMIALLAWTRFRRHGRERWYLASLAAFAAALLSKTAVLTLPLVVAALDHLVLRVRARSIAARLVPMLVLAAAALAVTTSFEQAFLEEASIPPPSIRPLIASAGIWFYTLKALVPVDLLPIYPRWHVSLTTIWWWIPLALLLVVAFVLWRARHRVDAHVLFGLVIYVAFLVPSSGLLAFGNMDLTFVSDHYVYIACIGLFLALVTALESVRLRLPFHPAAITAGVAASVVVLATATILYAPVFTDARTLWTRTLSGNPECFTAYSGLGQYHAARRAWSDSVENYSRAIAIKPEASDVRLALARAQIKRSDFSAAEANLEWVADASPGLTQPLMDLAYIAERTGRPRSAVELYERVLEIEPDNVAAHIRIGRTLLGFSEKREAADHFRFAIDRAPDDPWPYLGLATCQRGQGEFAEAVRTLEMGIAATAGSVSLLNLMARILATSPEDAVRDGPRAVVLALEAAERTSYEDCLTLDTLAAAYAETGDFAAAISTAESAARIAEEQGYERTALAISENALHYRAGSPLRESTTNLVLH